MSWTWKSWLGVNQNAKVPYRPRDTVIQRFKSEQTWLYREVLTSMKTLKSKLVSGKEPNFKPATWTISEFWTPKNTNGQESESREVHLCPDTAIQPTSVVPISSSLEVGASTQEPVGNKISFLPLTSTISLSWTQTTNWCGRRENLKASHLWADTVTQRHRSDRTSSSLEDGSLTEPPMKWLSWEIWMPRVRKNDTITVLFLQFYGQKMEPNI